jgi:outer membrane receptor protein involved in Fe transport
MRLLLVLALLLASSAMRVSAQQVTLAERGPRFLYASSSRAEPIEIDASSSAVLRRVVSLDLEQPTVGRLLGSIERQTGLRFAFERGLVPVDQPVALRAAAITVAAALTAILADANVDVLLSSGRQVVLVKRVPRGMVQEGSIVGRVTDKQSQNPLAGATVTVDGTRLSATSGNDGRYRIGGMAAASYTVRARYIGYAPASATVSLTGGQEATADFALAKSAQKLDEVVTTGTVIPTEVKSLPSPISIITADEIQQKNVQRVDQLFRGEVPGAFGWDPGSADFLSSINTRGATKLDVINTGPKTYVDGVEITDPAYVATIDPRSIDHIELIRGPQASTLYGSEALAGVMQIVTKAGAFVQPPQLDLKASAGTINSQWVSSSPVAQQDYTASLSGGSHSLTYNVGGGYSKVGEWLEEYSKARSSLYGTVHGKQGPLEVQLSGRYLNQQQDSPFLPIFAPYAGAPFYFKPTDLATTFQSNTVGLTLRYSVAARWHHSVTVGYDRFLQEQYRFAPRLVTPADTLLTLFDAEVAKTSVAYNTSLDLPLSPAISSTVVVGVDHYLLRDNITSIAGSSINGPITDGTLNYGYRTVYHNTGYFGQLTVGVMQSIFLTAGLRAEQNDNFGGDYGLAWSPRAGVAYVRSVGPVTVKVRGSYGKAIRAPFPFEAGGSISTTSVILPNAHLGPEIQKGPDAGIELYFGDKASLQATYYDQRADGLIDQVLVQAAAVPPQYQYQNIGRIKNRGWEVQGQAQLPARFSVTGAYSRTNSTVQALSATYAGDLHVGDQLSSIPKDVIGATLTYELPGGNISVGMTHVGTWINTDYVALYASYFGGQPFLPSYRIAYPSFTKYSLSISHELGRYLNAFVRADNLTNTSVYELDNTNPTMGRSLVGGLRARISLGSTSPSE